MDTTPGPSPVDFEILSHTFEMSPTIGAFAQALAKAQGMITHASASANNPYFDSKYADLAAVLDVCREPLSVNQIARYQAPLSLKTGEVGVKTMLIHSSGEWVASIIWCKPEKATPQTLGLVISYLRRYALAAAVGIAQRDDDAESAHGRGADAKAAEKKPSPAAQKAAATTADKTAQRAAQAKAKAPGAFPVDVPAGQVPVFVFRNGEWEFSGGFDAVIEKDHQARVKILQKELTIPQDIWAEKLVALYGKASSTQLSDREGLDLAQRLEAAKKIKEG
jgi:hypothetical protein